jgi:hypothetical protein
VYGDPHHRLTNVIWVHILNFVSRNPGTPMLCIRDMKNIMRAYEKLGPGAADYNRINIFCSYVKKCGFIDL